LVLAFIFAAQGLCFGRHVSSCDFPDWLRMLAGGSRSCS
jgi:hypothetical protein